MHLRRYAKALLAFVLICHVILFAPGLRAADEPAADSSTPAAITDTTAEKMNEAPAATEDRRARVGSFGVGVGTGGLGIDYAYPITRWLDVRVGYDFGSLSYDYEDDAEEEGTTTISGDAKLKFSSAKLLADFKPFKGGFRISAGLYTGSPELDLEAGGIDDYEVGDGEYRGDLDVDGNIDLGGVAPYLGIGWGGTAGTTGFGASFDIGVIFASSPDVSLKVTGMACDLDLDDDCDPNGAEGFDVNDPANPLAQEFQTELDNEVAEVEDDAKDFDMWPIVRLGLHYRF